MAAYEINCINKNDRYSIYERITHVGGPNNGSGSKWKVTVPDAIDGMRTKGWTFYVMQSGRKVNVIIAEGPNGPYLKTEADSINQNNLLSLPECR